ncbi:hypothetical protein OL548_25745 [Lysinibacillus sp. MHQ-1]|nr:hypothetical protein OL548_25745 [Lysinibacillus sp. MHQ-1]
MLRQWRLPPLLVELVELTYRFIFYFFSKACKKIHLAQQARLGHHSPMQWLRSMSMLITALFIEMFQRSRELNNAMQARGGETVYWHETAVYNKKNWLGMMAIFFIPYRIWRILLMTAYYFQLTNLSYAYADGTKALTDISLDIPKGKKNRYTRS